MSDEPPALPPPEEEALPPRPRRPLLPWLNTAAIVILAAGLVWLARQQIMHTPGQTDALAQQIGTIEARVARLEQKPAPQPADLGPLNARIAALEQRPAGAAPDLAPLEARVAALEQRPAGAAPDLAPLEARIGVLEQRKPTDLNPLEARVAALEAKQPADTQLAARLDALDKRLSANEQSADQRSARVVHVLAAEAALADGRPLGKLPDAPAALAKFADTPPPTLASLRLAFPAAVQEALAISPPPPQGRPWYARMWAEARELISIRRGRQVLLGDPAAGVLDSAREKLDAGDLAGTVDIVGSLSGQQAVAMRDWLADARALLAARAAFAEWAAHA
jgi:hypothetical protein